MKKSILCCSLLAIAALAAGCSEDTANPLTPTSSEPAAETEKNTDYYGLNIIPPTAEPFGLSYAEWSAKWWQWLWLAPVDVNPGLDATGEFVNINQEGPVWFLAPAYYGTWERTATIPNGKMIFIDLAGFCASISQGDGETEAEVRAVAESFADAFISNVIIEVDGQRLQHVEDFRFQTPPGMFDITLPDNNMFQWFGFDVPEGTYENDAVSDGYYAMLPPLTPGQHTIFLSADFGPPYDMTVQVTYNLTVVPGRSQKHIMD